MPTINNVNDFQDRIIDAIEQHVSLPSEIKEPSIKGKEGVAFGLMPMGQDTVFYNGSRKRTVAFQVLSQQYDQTLALGVLLNICSYLDSVRPGDIVSSNGSFELQSFGIQTTPNVVQEDKDGLVLYQCSYAADLLIKG